MFVSALLFSNLQLISSDDKVQVHFQQAGNQLEESKIKQVLAIPSTQVELMISNCEIEFYDENGDLTETRNVAGNDFARITNSFIMRDLYGHVLEIDLEHDQDGSRTRLKNIELEVQAIERIPVTKKMSRAFLPVYREIVDNFDSSYLRNLEVQESKMLIITHAPLLQTVQYFMDWKNARGIDTEVVLKEDIGTTNAQIKDYIINLYNTEEFPPDYLVLTGDVNGPFAIPSFYISSGSENNVTDHPYTLLEGDDYFPEMIVGRMSVDSNNELLTIISKVYHYEKTPYMGNTDWFESALLVAGNFSDSPPPPTTPVKVTMWLRDKMYDYGYQDITELYYWPPQYNVYPGTSQIISAINSGVGIVTYRGWGDANGWHYPRFHVSDMTGPNGLSNGHYLPIVTSIVCNTGDFANNVDPCFGEQWLTMGSPSSPAGGVAFVGPSDLHTRTKYNNAIFAGFYAGLLDEGIHSFGAAVLRGKYELWLNYPLQRDPGDWVEFYYNVYNILGDPSINIWTKIPQEISIILPDEISLGTNYLEIPAPGMDEAIVSVIKDSEIFAVEEIKDGSALLYFNAQTTGTMTVTVTKTNYHPYIKEIEVINQAVDVGLEDFSTSGAAIAGQLLDLAVTLKNFGSQAAASVVATLSTDNSYVNITNDTADFGNISANAAVTENFAFELLPSCPDNTIIEFELSISTGSTAKFELVAASLVLNVSNVTVDDENGVLEPYETSDILVEVMNAGSFDVSDLDVELVSLTDEVSITAAAANIVSLTTNAAVTVEFTVSASEDCYEGQNLSFRLDFSNPDGLSASAYFNLEAGLITNTVPTGPDSYGYYAYDSFDNIYTEAPVYNWIEIDPQEGGSGTVMLLGDDVSVTVPMPFDFPYYGVITDSITICTNGWISMQPTWETYFRNWNIPSALGPYGLIAPFWDDLIGEELSVGNHAPMRICHYYDSNQNIFIVEWNKCVNRFDNETVEKLQLILYDPAHYPTLTGDGEIQFNYQAVANIDHNNNYATVGIENFEQNDGLLMTFANQYPSSVTPLQDGLAYKFTTDPPQYIDLVVPTADFSADNESGIYPLEVQFFNETDFMFPANSYTWEFGDGEISNELHPTHIYFEVGTYDVSLTVSNPEGFYTEYKEAFITVIEPESPVAAFSADSFGGILPVTIQFSNDSTPEGEVNNYIWYFGDGNTSTEINPIYTYQTAGSYDVSLVAANMVGSDSTLAEGYIKVLEEEISVWPGDTDSNGMVDLQDILPIGIYWRERGNERQSVSFSWIGHEYPDGWDVELAAFADCNGDGKVNIADVLGICLNWQKTNDNILNSPLNPGNLLAYRDNFAEIYEGLGNFGTELKLKNFLAEEFDFPVVGAEMANMLQQNYPNPFNPTTNISFDLAETGLVEISIYNIKGQLVTTLVREEKPVGNHNLTWSGKDAAGRKVSSGLYFYRMRLNEDVIDIKKMLLLK